MSVKGKLALRSLSAKTSMVVVQTTGRTMRTMTEKLLLGHGLGLEIVFLNAGNDY